MGEDTYYRNMKNTRWLKLVLSFFILITIFACQKPVVPDIQDSSLIENGYYTSKEDVSLYIKTYHRLPDNYITKDEARNLGWDSDKGNLWEVTDKMSIGGDRFSNREGLLPKSKDIIYYECDIDYEGGYRNAKRIVYSNQWAIYYTGDHYDSFELLYEGD